jgi:hypothetical protein
MRAGANHWFSSLDVKLHEAERCQLRARYANATDLVALSFRAEPLRNNVTNTGDSGDLIVFGVFSNLDPLGLEALAIKSTHVAPSGGGLCWNTYEHFPTQMHNLAFVQMYVRPTAVRPTTVPPDLLTAWDKLLDQCITQYSEALQAYGSFPSPEDIHRRLDPRLLVRQRPEACNFVICKVETRDERIFLCVFDRRHLEQVQAFVPIKMSPNGMPVPLQFGPPGNIPLNVPMRQGSGMDPAFHCWFAWELEHIVLASF